MKKISEVVNKELFLNAYDICLEHFENKHIIDINLLLLQNKFNTYTRKNISKYYDDIINSDIVYAIPELFSTEIVNIPKGINGIREYRFFTMFSMILYNSMGLVLIDLCNESINQLKFTAEKVFSFSPTKFSKSNEKWYAKNDYQKEYFNYTEKVKDFIEPGSIVLKIDISKYFDSISHNILLDIIESYSLKSTLAKYNYDSNIREVILFYFESMMTKKIGIPQGKKNLVSDYFGNLYLKKFDEEVKQLCDSELLEYKAMIRYVDDGLIIFKRKKSIVNSKVHKELSQIEHKISKYLLQVLGLSLNDKKSEYHIIENVEDVDQFLRHNNKKISTKNNEKKEEKIDEIKNKYNDFINAISIFRFNDDISFKFGISIIDREYLKEIYNSSFIKYLENKSIRDQVINEIQKIDIELTVDSISMIIALFFIKNNNKLIYLKPLEEYFKSDLQKLDRRSIHILLMAITQGYDMKNIKTLIVKNEKLFLNDNYGRYILLFNSLYKYNNYIGFLDDLAIYNRLSWEKYVKKKKKYSRKFLPGTNDPYSVVVSKIISNKLYNEALTEQLKNFVFYYVRKEWDLSFNYFYNFFHEICKIKKYIKDDGKIIDIVKKLSELSLISATEEMILRKFSDRRNFNPVSHSSKKGSKSIKVTNEDMKDFLPKILEILKKII